MSYSRCLILQKVKFLSIKITEGDSMHSATLHKYHQFYEWEIDELEIRMSTKVGYFLSFCSKYAFSKQGRFPHIKFQQKKERSVLSGINTI